MWLRNYDIGSRVLDIRTAEAIIHTELSESASLHNHLLHDQVFTSQLVQWSDNVAQALFDGGTAFFAGNGGSFADAQHFAAELSGKMRKPRAPLAGVALGTNASSFSAIANDFSYAEVFSRELRAFWRPHSILLALSTSGKSQNILRLLDEAQQLGMPSLLVTGQDGVADVSEFDVICLPSLRTERIQELTVLFGHLLCLLVEERLGLT